jgi:hypothetical protein
MTRAAILAFGLLSCGLTAAPASAAFLTSYAGWSRLTGPEKLAYVQGLNDASSVVDTGAAFNPVQAAMVRGRVTCMARDKVTAQLLAALIDQRYRTDPSARDLPPMSIFERETFRICRQDIDAAVDAARQAGPSTPRP